MSDKRQSKEGAADAPHQVPGLNPNKKNHVLQTSTEAPSTVETTPIDDLEATKTAMSQTTPREGTFAELPPDTTSWDPSTTERKNLDAKPRASKVTGEESKFEETAFVAEERNDLDEARKGVPAVAPVCPSPEELLSIPGPSAVIEGESNTEFQEVRPGCVAVPNPGPEPSMSDDEELGGGEDSVPLIMAQLVDPENIVVAEVVTSRCKCFDSLRSKCAAAIGAIWGRVLIMAEVVTSRCKCFDSPRSKRAAIMVGIVVVVLIIVVPSVLLAGGKDSPPLNASPPTASPPTQALEDLLAAASSDQGEALRNSSTPQSKALTWLANSTNVDNYTDQQKIQRYSLAALYYSTGGDGWERNGGWLSDEDECTWYESGDHVGGDVCTDGDLATLDLSANNLHGTVPPEISMLGHSLVGLNLKGNALMGSIPTEMGLLTSLNVLKLFNNSFTGTIPTELGVLSNLAQLDLPVNALTGAIPSEIALLTNLNFMALNSNNLVGKIPSGIGLLIYLNWLALNSNNLAGIIPPEIGLLTYLKTLRLSENMLTGSIPTEISLLTNLEELWLFDNKLMGPIPTQIALLTNLKDELKLWNNLLTGTIPSELGLMTKLTLLDLPVNALTGAIPSEIALLTNLNWLALNSNNLTGIIPPEIGLLTYLKTLRLYNNMLTGSIPTEISLLTNLEYLHLYGNRLTGNFTCPDFIEGCYISCETDCFESCINYNDVACRSL